VVAAQSRMRTACIAIIGDALILEKGYSRHKMILT